jgi:hypothetical protein
MCFAFVEAKARRYVRSSSRRGCVGGQREAVPRESVKEALTIAELANQAVRPAYPKFDEGCSVRPRWGNPSK